MKPKFGVGTFFNYLVIGLLGFITVYPFIFILSTSVTPAAALVRGRIILWPLGFDLTAYRLLLTDNRMVTGFVNSVQYTLVGTTVGVFFTTLTAYPLAQIQFKRYASIYMKLVVFTMLFSGGMIPTFLVINRLGLVDSFWVMILPGAVSPFSLILVRTFMQQIPSEMYEAGRVEGASEFQMFWRIIIPLSTPIIATIALFHSVGIWNSFATPMIYLRTESRFPLQIFLRQIVLLAQMQEQMMYAQGFAEGTMLMSMQFNTEALRSATLVVSTIPILLAYPFLQRHFVKGIMVGAIKG